MDQTDLRLSLKQAEASLELSNAQLETLKQESENVQASLKLQRSSLELSQNELKRHEQMYAEKQSRGKLLKTLKDAINHNS